LFISSETREAFLTRFPQARDRISADTPWFSDAIGRDDSSSIRDEVIRAAMRPYYVAFGYTGLRKGTDILAKAYAEYRRLGGTAHLSVMVSGPDDGRVKALFVEPRESVTFISRVNDTERDHLLAHARGLLFPSRCEGFGLPLLEALGLGTWPLAFRGTPAEEVLGRPDKLATWGDYREFARLMLKADQLWNSGDERDILKEREGAVARNADFNRERFDGAVYDFLSQVEPRPSH